MIRFSNVTKYNASSPPIWDRPSVMYIPLSRRELQFTNVSFKRHQTFFLCSRPICIIFIFTSLINHKFTCLHADTNRSLVWGCNYAKWSLLWQTLQKQSLQRKSELCTFSYLHTHVVYNPRKYRFAGRLKGHDSTSTLEIHSVHHLLLAIEMVIYFCFSNHRLIITITELF